MVLPFFLLSIFTSGAIAGSLCPPRENIYPCSCINIPLTKKTFTTSVYCHHVQSTDSLTAIFPNLRSMQIDILHLYDSFWEAHKLESNGEDKRVLPTDWITLLKVKEFDIVDTTLSQCFACQGKLACRNTFTQRFSVTNSSSHENICTLCDSGRNNKYPWTSCLSRLRHFHFSHGKLPSLSSQLFAFPMKELMVLNLTHNEISVVEAKAMQNLPRLKSLDLSHNIIHSLQNVFNSAMNLEFLDVSWNSIQSLGDNFFTNLKQLKTFNAGYNLIQNMKEKEWNVPGTLRNIDLTDNQLHCDCSVRWVNSTFHVSTVLVGWCASPEEYENSLLRTASRKLEERCVGNSIGTRKNIKPTKAMTMLRKIK